MELKLHKIYKLQFPVPGNTVVAELVEIDTYPASGMPVDYIFKYVSGARDLPDSSDEGKLKFRQNWWRKAHESATKEEIAKFGPMPTEIPVEERMTFAFPEGLLPRLKITEVTQDYQITPEDNEESKDIKEHKEKDTGGLSYDSKPEKSFYPTEITGVEIVNSAVEIRDCCGGFNVSLTDKIRIFYTGKKSNGKALVPDTETADWSEEETHEIFSWNYIYFKKDAVLIKKSFDLIAGMPITFSQPKKREKYFPETVEDRYRSIMKGLQDQRDKQLKEILKTNKRLFEIKDLIGNIEMFLKAKDMPPSINTIFIPKSLSSEVVDLNSLPKEELVRIISLGLNPNLKEQPSYDEKLLGKVIPVGTSMFLDFTKKKVAGKFKFTSQPKQLINKRIFLQQFHEVEVVQIASTRSFDYLCKRVDSSSKITEMLEPIREELKRNKSKYVGKITESIYFNGDRYYTFEYA